MRAEQDEVALQGIEFWSNVCDEEVDLQIEASEATEAGRPPEHVSRLEHRFTSYRIVIGSKLRFSRLNRKFKEN